MKRLILLSLCAFLLCSCATPTLQETTATTPQAQTTTQTTTEATTVETTIESTITTTEQTTTEMTTVATETTYVETLGETKIKLSTMSEEDCRKFLSEAGVEVPPQLEDIKTLSLVKTYEDDPDRYFVVSWTVLLDFYDNVRDVVREYYGLPPFEYWY